VLIRQILIGLPAKAASSAPWVTYTEPELANVGLTEAMARERGLSVEIQRWPYAENDRAQAERKTHGFIKVVLDKKGRILGAGIAGAGAGEMIHVWALAVAKSMKVGDMLAYVPPYPTMAEIGRRASVAHFAPQTRRPLVRKIIGFLRAFG
jgi:pyruvate/2-oxoglutarate dehydrogenase complex dihydrolipoamide dehydrogenase (E3) component